MSIAGAAPIRGSVHSREVIASFHEHLLKSTRILALCGAGLSASSGLPTFRGAGGLWRTHESTSLATPQAFARDPGLVWQFYNYRRHMALRVAPNRAHHALAELARRTRPGRTSSHDDPSPSPAREFVTLTQNVDGLSARADHPAAALLELHGSLFTLRCADRGCRHEERNFDDPVVPALAPPRDETRGEAVDPTSNAARAAAQVDISDASVPLPTLNVAELPQCPTCRRSVLRPGVVWFGESLPRRVLDRADAFIDDAAGIDLVLVIGTSSQVFPAAGYVHEARQAGARVCVINMDDGDGPAGGWAPGDWMFKGDAAEIVPVLLEPLTGPIDMPGHDS